MKNLLQIQKEVQTLTSNQNKTQEEYKQLLMTYKSTGQESA